MHERSVGKVMILSSITKVKQHSRTRVATGRSPRDVLFCSRVAEPYDFQHVNNIVIAFAALIDF